MLKVVFFGTPAVAVPFLEKLSALASVRGVVTAPDKPAGRGYAVQSPAVKAAADKLGLPVFQPATLKGFSLEALGPLDLGLVVAYGKLIPPEIFDMPRFGLVNVHFSLLPKYRGAGPVQWALIHGERETGVSLFRIEKGLDTGPVYLKKAVTVGVEDDSAVLRERLVEAGLELTEELFRGLEAGNFTAQPQQGEPTFAPLLKKEDGLIRWEEKTAEQIACIVRGTYEWPGAFTRFRGKTVKIRSAVALSGGEGVPGTLISLERGEGLLVQCRSGRLKVRRLQPEGKREMSADDFWNGFRPSPGERFEV